ncbi:MAG: hypothetical protein BGO37_05325 [Cellulomonas sp. 73-92]|uniref:alpha/beta fold hydrolase n=1 Tax=Cellulomonas sp. 73-92 TaxID=1895740 RepID=UPI000927DCD9|nr:alpha/beta fold hydrolase [Cellulomonas sp. 73-92]OJV82390.1 MAG: hypothetical protein BGO37_05325 [Cellulomonas sp. 73-92]
MAVSSRRTALLALVALGALGAAVAARRLVRGRRDASVAMSRGVFDGMGYTVLGTGPTTLLHLPGGPGSDTTSGSGARFTARQLAPFAAAGYTVWNVDRRRDMPAGHSIADMADDHAAFIRAKLGGRADVVLGRSYGGLVALYLAADHPDLVGRLVLTASAATITPWGKDVDLRWARARAEHRYADAGAIMLEYPLPGRAWAPARRRLGPLVGRMFADSAVPDGDLVVEGEAEAAFDARDVLGRIQAPVLVLSGTKDRFFPPTIVEETAALIPDCTVVRYPGGHLRASMNGHAADDVATWVSGRRTADSTTP